MKKECANSCIKKQITIFKDVIYMWLFNKTFTSTNLKARFLRRVRGPKTGDCSLLEQFILEPLDVQLTL